MSRFDPARLDSASYPFSHAVETRFQDLDPLGHINNVAMAAIFETGRVMFNRTQLLERQQRDKGDRWLIARNDVNYLAEAHFPEPVTIASAVGSIANRSWAVVSGAFQGGQCVALCDTVIVYTGPDGAKPISDAFRAELERWTFKPAS